jgi:hypothetical protein
MTSIKRNTVFYGNNDIYELCKQDYYLAFPIYNFDNQKNPNYLFKISQNSVKKSVTFILKEIIKVYSSNFFLDLNNEQRHRSDIKKSHEGFINES